MKSLSQICEEVGYALSESTSTRTKSKTGTWKIESAKESHNAVLVGHNENVTAKITIQLSFSKWIIEADIKDKDGHSVGRFYMNAPKSYKQFPTKWKKEVGHLIKAPSDSLMKEAFTKVHDTNAKNFFYQYTMVD